MLNTIPNDRAWSPGDLGQHVILFSSREVSPQKNCFFMSNIKCSNITNGVQLSGVFPQYSITRSYRFNFQIFSEFSWTELGLRLFIFVKNSLNIRGSNDTSTMEKLKIRQIWAVNRPLNIFLPELSKVPFFLKSQLMLNHELNHK